MDLLSIMIRHHRATIIIPNRALPSALRHILLRKLPPALSTRAHSPNCRLHLRLCHLPILLPVNHRCSRHSLQQGVQPIQPRHYQHQNQVCPPRRCLRGHPPSLPVLCQPIQLRINQRWYRPGRIHPPPYLPTLPRQNQALFQQPGRR